MPELVIIALLLAWSAWSWLLVANHRSVGGWRALPPFEPRRPVPWTALEVLVIALGYLAVQAALVGLVVAAFPDQGAAAPPAAQLATELAASALGNLLALVGAALLLRRAARATMSDLGWGAQRAGRDVWLGLVAFGVVAVPIYALQALLTQVIPPHHPILELLEQRWNPWVGLVSFVAAVVVAPVVEEFLFRGVLQGWLERLVTPDEPPEGAEFGAATLGAAESPGTTPERVAAGSSRSVVKARLNHPAVAPALPILLSSLAFASMHLGQGPAPIPLFFLSLVLGWLYHQTHRLTPSIVLHATLNAVSLAVAWLGGQ